MRQENQTFKLVYITSGRVITCAVRTSPPRSRSPKSLEHKHHNKELRSPSLVATNSKDQEVENNLQCEKHAWKSALGSKASMGVQSSGQYIPERKAQNTAETKGLQTHPKPMRGTSQPNLGTKSHPHRRKTTSPTPPDPHQSHKKEPRNPVIGNTDKKTCIRNVYVYFRKWSSNSYQRMTETCEPALFTVNWKVK